MFTGRMLKIVGCCLLSTAMLLTSAAQKTQNDAQKELEDEEQEYRRRLEEGVKDNRKIDFWGKVVDEQGEPLPGVKITLNIRQVHPVHLLVGKDIARSTDKSGLFSVLNEKGTTLIVGELKLAGYRSGVDNYRGFIYLNPDLAAEEERPPTKDNPAVFVLQKIGTVVPLIKVGGSKATILTSDGAFHEINFMLGLGQSLYNALGKKYKDSPLPALQARWEFTEGGERWVIKIRGKHDGDEVRVSDQRFYEAPAAGYFQEDTILIPQPVPPASGGYKEAYIYLRTGKPITYSRVEIGIYYGIRPDKNLRIVAIKTFTNPYGTRSLEQAPFDSLYGGLAGYPFLREALQALARGENPRLPTEDELLEFKAKRDKEKAESDARLAEQMKKIREDERKRKR